MTKIPIGSGVMAFGQTADGEAMPLLVDAGGALKYSPSIPNILTVSATGGDYDDIQDAIDRAVAKGCDASHPWLIVVAPGVYTLTEPLQMRPGCNLSAMVPGSVLIQGTAVGDDLVLLTSDCRLYGLRIEHNPSETAATAAVGYNLNPTIENITIDNCDIYAKNWGINVTPQAGVVLNMRITRCRIDAANAIWLGAHVDCVVDGNITKHASTPQACAAFLDASSTAAESCYGLIVTNNTCEIQLDANLQGPSEGPYGMRIFGNALTVHNNRIHVRYTGGGGATSATSGIIYDDSVGCPANYKLSPISVFSNNLVVVESDGDIGLDVYACVAIAHNKAKSSEIRLIDNTVSMAFGTVTEPARINGASTGEGAGVCTVRVIGGRYLNGVTVLAAADDAVDSGFSVTG